MESNVKFVFDLDGTITAEETLPLIARHFNIEAEISALTQDTLSGKLPFAESFRRRVDILGNLPIDEISELLAGVPLHSKVVDFIADNKENCAIATGNLCFWIDALVRRIGCTCHSSQGISEQNRVKKVTRILKKEDIVRLYRSEGYKVVFIGDSNNDMEAMRLADISVAAGLTHWPASSVLAVAQHIVFDEDALCRQLYASREHLALGQMPRI